MAKLNESLRAKLVFEKTDVSTKECPYPQTKISTTHDGIYMECVYVNYPTDIQGNPQDQAQLEEETKNIHTYSIEYELNKRKNDSEREGD